MNPKTRNNFITQESALGLTLINMNDSSVDDDSESLKSRKKRRKKGLYSRLKAYAKNDAHCIIKI